MSNDSDGAPISPSQCRAARALVDWSQDDLAGKAGVSRKTIADYEAGKRSTYASTMSDLRRALEKAGIEFIPQNGGGPGVRLRKRR